MDSNSNFSVVTVGATGALTNLPYYEDACDYYNLHLYNDGGIIPPNASTLDKPWIVGEAGATDSPTDTPEHYADPAQPYEMNAVKNFLATGKPMGALAVLFWAFTGNPNFDTIVNGQVVLGPVGEYLVSTAKAPLTTRPLHRRGR